MELRDYLLNAAVAVATFLSTIFAIKRSKEDAVLGKTGQALETWQNLAESNKDNWDDCEAKCERLNERINKQAIEIDTLKELTFTLRGEMAMLKMQMTGKMNLDESNKQD